jgi:hypothetical protein
VSSTPFLSYSLTRSKSYPWVNMTDHMHVVILSSLICFLWSSFKSLLLGCQFLLRIVWLFLVAIVMRERDWESLGREHWGLREPHHQQRELRVILTRVKSFWYHKVCEYWPTLLTKFNHNALHLFWGFFMLGIFTKVETSNKENTFIHTNTNTLIINSNNY